MICNYCGANETYLQDGILYCKECSEQIKGSIDEVADEESFTKKSLLTSTAKKTKTTKQKTLSPWLHSEAYNLILCKQVEALIKLGCSEKLKTVVFYIWAKYLQKCEAAFHAPLNKEFKPRLSFFANARDMELLYGEGLSTNIKKLKRLYFKTRRRKKDYQKRKPKIKDTKSSDYEMTSEDESFCCSSDDEKILLDSTASSSEASGDENFKPSSDTEGVRKKKRFYAQYSTTAKELSKKGFRATSKIAQERCVSYMTLLKTLSFCYLGLLYTEDQMLLFDLLRLVNEGAVPYIDAARHFDTSMQMQATDITIFKKEAAPYIRKVSYTSSQLIDFLQLPKYKEPPLLPVAIRFVKDFNLPNGLIPVLKLFISKIERETKLPAFLRRRKVNLPFYEAQAMSVLAVALKMIFVLDGKFEIEHSEIMTKLNSVSDGETYFVWKDWQQQMALKEYLFMKKYIEHENSMNRLDTLCADRINAGYPVNLIHQDLSTNIRHSSTRFACRVELESLMKELVIHSSLEKYPTSFPLKYEMNRLMKDWKKMTLFKDTENIDFSFINKDFSNHKLYYRPSTKTDEPMNVLLTSLYESVKLIHITSDEEYCENIVRTTNKYWYNPSLNTKEYSDKRPGASSFNWLFNFMHKYLQIEKLDFYKEFKYIEHYLVNT